MDQRKFETQGRVARTALVGDHPVEFERVTVNGIEYFAEPGETQRAAIKRIRTSSGRITARGHLTILRDRAKRPFWVQHERKNLRVHVSGQLASERAARKLFNEARNQKGTKAVFLFQHAIDKTIIVDQYTDNGVIVGRPRHPRQDAPIRDELR